MDIIAPNGRVNNSDAVAAVLLLENVDSSQHVFTKL